MLWNEDEDKVFFYCQITRQTVHEQVYVKFYMNLFVSLLTICVLFDCDIPVPITFLFITVECVWKYNLF